MEWTIPNILSLYRIIAAPFLVLCGWFGQPTLFFILLGSMLLTDALDGIIARVLNQTSHLGARLDTYGDILTYLSTLLAVWWLWPHIITNELNYMIAAALFYVIPALISLIKFGNLASYHTWITKLSAVLMAFGIALLLLFENNRLFHIAVYFLILEMLENIIITLMLKEQKSDIHSIWHALKTRR